MAAGGECWLQRPPSFSGQADRPRGSWWECRVPPAPTCRCPPFATPPSAPALPANKKEPLMKALWKRLGSFQPPSFRVTASADCGPANSGQSNPTIQD